MRRGWGYWHVFGVNKKEIIIDKIYVLAFHMDNQDTTEPYLGAIPSKI